MPVSSRGNPARQAIWLGLAAVLAVVAVIFLVSRVTDLAERGEVTINIGDSTFQVGNVERLADDLAAQGPLLIPDVAGGDRDIILNHVGDDDRDGWFAFGVRAIDQPRDCFVTWDPDAEVFADNCTEATYPPDGDGLLQYPVTIDGDGNLSVDLNYADRAE